MTLNEIYELVEGYKSLMIRRLKLGMKEESVYNYVSDKLARRNYMYSFNIISMKVQDLLENQGWYEQFVCHFPIDINDKFKVDVYLASLDSIKT